VRAHLSTDSHGRVQVPNLNESRAIFNRLVPVFSAAKHLGMSELSRQHIAAQYRDLYEDCHCGVVVTDA